MALCWSSVELVEASKRARRPAPGSVPSTIENVDVFDALRPVLRRDLTLDDHRIV